MIKKRIINKIDKPLFIVTIISLIIGVLMVFSASSLKSFMVDGNSFKYFERQLFFILTGLILFLLVIVTPLRRYKRVIYLMLIGLIVGLLYVLFSDKIMNGIKGWIFIFGFGIQPSEFAKTILILFFALYFDDVSKNPNFNKLLQFLPFIISLIVMSLVMMQPDLGTMLILALICFMMFLIAPYEKKSKFVLFTLTIFLTVIVVITMLITGKGLNNTQKERFNYKNPCSRYREDTGYQVCNGYIAINSGGLLGSGPGNSKQKYLYLPEAHTDFIFAIIIEELGLISGIIILILYFIIIWRIISIGKKSYKLSGTVICYGVATYIVVHIFFNLGGLMGLIPLTGVPLPFYSYGGSFMWNLLICLGLVQRVCIENKLIEQKYLVR